MKAIERALERMIEKALGEVTAEEKKINHNDYECDHGCSIVVLDQGWVYVGNVTVTGDWMVINDARNIRICGTTTGLGRLLSGPLPGTEFEPSGNVICPIKSVISIMQCNPNHNW